MDKITIASDMDEKDIIKLLKDIRSDLVWAIDMRGEREEYIDTAKYKINELIGLLGGE